LGVILAVTGDVNRFRNYRRYVVYTGYYAGLERSRRLTARACRDRSL
jgi:hypothetical protein